MSSREADKEVPALKELGNEISIYDINTEVEKEFNVGEILERDAKIYLITKYTREQLTDIGIPSGIGESGVSQVTRRFLKRCKEDKSLKRRVNKIERNLSRMKT